MKVKSLDGSIPQVLLIAGLTVALGVIGVVAAAYSAHLFAHPVPVGRFCPCTMPAIYETPRAGPAWLFSGLAVGMVLGAAIGIAVVRHRVRRTSPPSSMSFAETRWSS